MRQRRLILFVPLVLILAAALLTPAPGESAGAKRAVVVKGEILDLGCYLARGLHGSIHRDCAHQCLAAGIPMGIMAQDSTLYLLTQDHGRAMAPSSYSTPDAYAQCREWASLTVEVTGGESLRNGVHVLEVVRAKLVPAEAPSPAHEAGTSTKTH
jgi:hypothetical protein